MICVEIDEITNCLKKVDGNEEFPTEVKRIISKTILSRFTEKTQWYENWVDLSKENEIFGLFLQGSEEVEGLVAIDPRRNRDALYVTWMVAAPHNNVDICGRGNQRYIGVGGHLFAIAIRKSVEYGYGGAIYGFAKDAEKLAHYEKWFGAEYIGILHEFHFLIADSSAVNVVEDYSYDETGEEL